MVIKRDPLGATIKERDTLDGVVPHGEALLKVLICHSRKRAVAESDLQVDADVRHTCSILVPREYFDLARFVCHACDCVGLMAGSMYAVRWAGGRQPKYSTVES